jgi:hypothetical protein
MYDASSGTHWTSQMTWIGRLRASHQYNLKKSCDWNVVIGAICPSSTIQARTIIPSAALSHVKKENYRAAYGNRDQPKPTD